MGKLISHITCIAAIVFLLCSFAKSPKLEEKLQTVPFEQLDSLQAIKQKKVVVFIHTDWCKYCLQMSNTTFKNDSIISLLNDHFYFVDLDAETKNDIKYKGYAFKYKPSGANTGVHELAEQLGEIEGKLNYPTISIINHKNEIIFQNGGLMKTNEMLTLLSKLYVIIN